MRVGKKKLPRVQRLALKTLLAVEVRGAVDMIPFYADRLMTGFNAPWRDYSLRLPVMLFFFAG